MSEVLARLLETGLVDGQQALLQGGLDLSPAATGVMEQARTAVVLAAHLIADKVGPIVGWFCLIRCWFVRLRLHGRFSVVAVVVVLPPPYLLAVALIITLAPRVVVAVAVVVVVVVCGQDDGDVMVPEVLHATFLVDNHVSGHVGVGVQVRPRAGSPLPPARCCCL